MEEDTDDYFDIWYWCSCFKSSYSKIVQMIPNSQNIKYVDNKNVDVPEENSTNQRCIQLIQELIEGM